MESSGPAAATASGRENLDPSLADATNRVASLSVRDGAPAPVVAGSVTTVAAAAVAVPVIKPVIPLKPIPANKARPKDKEEDSVRAVERAIHQGYTEEALDMARLALRTNETPVGCVLVHKGRIIAKGMNATNVSRNGTRHAEYMALGALLAYTEDAVSSVSRRSKRATPVASDSNTDYNDDALWASVDPSQGHLYPYGQKLHPAPRVDKSVVRSCILYVTVEPCVMCASLLRQLGVKKVYFGAVNDKFGGTGGVFRIHMNSLPVPTCPPPTRSVMGGRVVRITLPKENGTSGDADEGTETNGTQQPVPQIVLPDASSPASSIASLASDSASPPPTATTAPVPTVTTLGMYGPPRNTTWVIKEPDPPPPPSPPSPFPLPSNYRHPWRPDGDGDGGNVEVGYDAEGGWGRDDAVTLLRQFYVQENGRAPVPRKKEGRAARLAAMMEKEAMASQVPILVGDEENRSSSPTGAENEFPGSGGDGGGGESSSPEEDGIQTPPSDGI